jgi:hypothetical protein
MALALSFSSAAEIQESAETDELQIPAVVTHGMGWGSQMRF